MADLVNRRCEVLFDQHLPNGGTWYAGRIFMYYAGTDLHHVIFDDNTRLKIHVAAHEEENILRWLEDEAPPAVEPATAPDDDGRPISQSKPSRLKKQVERFEAAPSKRPRQASGQPSGGRGGKRKAAAEPPSKNIEIEISSDDDDDDAEMEDAEEDDDDYEEEAAEEEEEEEDEEGTAARGEEAMSGSAAEAAHRAAPEGALEAMPRPIPESSDDTGMHA